MRFPILFTLLVLISACSMTEAERRAFAQKKAEEAMRLYDRKLWEEAVECAEDGLDEDPACIDAVRVKARSLVKLLSIDEAFRMLVGDASCMPSADDSSVEPANDASALPATLSTDAVDFRVACLEEAARLAMNLDQPSLAIHYLSLAADLRPGSADLLTRKGMAEVRCGRELAARRTFEEALVAGADLRIILPQLAQIAYKLQEYDEAARQLEKIGREDLTAQELILYGAICCEQKRFSRGLDLFREAENKDETLPEALFNQGRALEAMNKVRYAMTIYRKLLERDDTYSPALYQLGDLLFKQGEQDEGLAYIDRAIKHEKDPKIKRSLESSKEKLVHPAPAEADENAEEEATSDSASQAHDEGPSPEKHPKFERQKTDSNESPPNHPPPVFDAERSEKGSP